MKQALKLALEWIEKQPEETPHSKYDVDTRYVVLRELEAALEQPEQEGGVCGRCGGWVSDPVITQPEKLDQDEVDIRSRLYQRIHELETQLAQPERDYERGFIDGMQKQMQSSVDKAVNAMSRTWVGLTDEEIQDAIYEGNLLDDYPQKFVAIIEKKLKEKNT